MISRPTSVLPVKAILSTSGCVQRVLPSSPPGPGMTLNTPLGMPAALAASARMRARQWGVRGRLYHDGVAHDQGRRDLPHRQGSREVPGDDAHAHADRLPDDEFAARREGVARGRYLFLQGEFGDSMSAPGCAATGWPTWQSSWRMRQSGRHPCIRSWPDAGPAARSGRRSPGVSRRVRPGAGRSIRRCRRPFSPRQWPPRHRRFPPGRPWRRGAPVPGSIVSKVLPSCSVDKLAVDEQFVLIHWKPS